MRPFLDGMLTDDPLERNPRVFAEYTTARVLTIEYLDGVPVIDIITAIRRRDTAFLRRLAARGHDLKRIAAHIVWNALNQIYRFGYFHADPHPANLIVLRDDAIGYVDFGIVGKLDDQTTAALRYFAQTPVRGTHGRCRRGVHAVPDAFGADGPAGGTARPDRRR